MTALIDKAKAGSPISDKDLVDALKWSLNKQDFDDFYQTAFDDYISGVPETPAEKEKLAHIVNQELRGLFSPIFALLPRVNEKHKNLLSDFIQLHFTHGLKINDKLKLGRIDVVCEKCRQFQPVGSPK